MNKALLKIDGKAIIERIAEVINPMFSEVLLVTNSPNDFKSLGSRSVGDVVSTHGSLTGIYSGLVQSETYHSFFFACDMAFIKPDLVRFMIGESQGYDVIIPRGKDGLEPLHSIYSKDCISHIEGQLQQDDLKILDFFPQIRLKIIEEPTISRFDPGQIGFFNINTKSDYERALRIGGRRWGRK